MSGENELVNPIERELEMVKPYIRLAVESVNEEDMKDMLEQIVNNTEDPERIIKLGNKIKDFIDNLHQKNIISDQNLEIIKSYISLDPLQEKNRFLKVAEKVGDTSKLGKLRVSNAINGMYQKTRYFLEKNKEIFS